MASAYVDQHLAPTLSKALTELCRAKPKEPVSWLAAYLQAHKPPPAQHKAGALAAQQALLAMFHSEEGRAALKALWDDLDKDGDGTVTSKEWGKGVKANWKTMGKFFGGSTISEVGKMFKTLDVDGSGDLTWSEFEGAVSGLDTAMMVARAMQTSEGAAELKGLFETLDKDGDGKVTSKEWGKSVSQNKEMLAKYFGGKDAKTIGKAFKRLDADGSGDLTWDEFVAGSQRLVEMA